MLLAVFPFVAAAVLYWMSCADLFGANPRQVPDNWTARLFLPVLAGSLSALAAAAALKERDDLLLSAAGFGVLFSIVVAAALRGGGTFFDLQEHVPLGRRRFRRLRKWHLVRYAGLGVIVYSCVATLIAVK